MASYLVTGGCGFIGSHLVAALRRRGDAVRVLDNLSTGHRANLAPGATLLLGDVADPAALRQAMAGVDACFHLAAVASVAKCAEDWFGTHRTNLAGTVAVLDTARCAGPGGTPLPVIYASSAAVYGRPAALPLHEDLPVRPLSAYGADKLGGELHARAGGLVHGIPTVGLRFFNVFGPRQDPRSPYSGVISIFCDRLSRGEPIDIYGAGAQTRDFVHVGDVVAALLGALQAAAISAPVFNVCTGRPTTVLDLAETIARLAGARAAIRHQPERRGEIRHSLGAPERAREALRLGPPLPLDIGLAEVLDWLRAGAPALVPAALAEAAE